MALELSAATLDQRIGDPDAVAIVITATGATGTVHWAVDAGGLSAATGVSSTLTPLNQTRIVIVTANDNVETVIIEIQIWATFPYQPKWEIEPDIDDETEISIAEDNVPKFRVVSDLSAQYPMIYEKRSFEEYWAALQFYDWHRKSKPFYIDDISTGLLVFGYFDSAIRPRPSAADYIAYAFQFKSYAFSIPPDPTTGPFLPAGAYLLEGGGNLLLED